MELTYALIMGTYGLLMGLQMRPMFADPFASHSLHEWWSRRWNLLFKDQYYLIVFQVLHNCYGTISAESSSSSPLIDKQRITARNQKLQLTKRQRRFRNSVAALSTFAFSGLLHEYYAYCSFGRRITGENMAYFLVHGLLTTIQVQLLSRWLSRMGWESPALLKVVLTTSVLVLTMPLFLGPHLRTGFYMDIAVPYLPGIPHRFASLLFHPVD
jgi:hypothetical protein